MKSLTNAVDVAVDSVCFLVGVLGWSFIIWAPIFIGIVLLVVSKGRTQGSLFIFAAFSSIFILLGVVLNWLAKGIANRSIFQTVISAAVLGLFAISAESPSFATREGLSQLQRLDHRVMGVLLLVASAVLVLGQFRSSSREDG